MNSGHAVLLVDDEVQLLQGSATYLRRLGYTVGTAENAREALTLLAERRYDAMVCDIRMPEISGLELVPRALELDPELAVVMLSGVDDATSAKAALHAGAIEYIVKPTPLASLADVVARSVQRREHIARKRREQRARRAEQHLRAAAIEAERQTLRHRSIGVIEALVTAMEAKDPFLGGRSERIARLAGAIAEELGLEPGVVEDVRTAGRLHDVGMLGIRESVLNKVEKLTPEEFEHIKDHVRIGMEILSPLEHLGGVLDFVQDHHERWDGTGYPRRIAGDTISIGGRILAAADAYDALTSGRAFRRASKPEEALETIGYLSGAMLEPAVYAALCVVVRRG